jgi:flagellar hook-length control protein FliK
VVQGLAAHFQAAGVDAVGVVSGQANQAIATGIGHGMGAMADMQGRSVPSGVHMAIDVPVRSPMFPQELGERIVWLSTRQGQMADIALNPPHLGPLEVKLSLSGGEAGAQFFSPHAQVRDAIEAALPRLREMMAEAGVTLGQAQVRDEAFTRQESLAHGDASANVGGSDSDEQSLRAGGLGVVRSMGLGLVDVFV